MNPDWRNDPATEDQKEKLRYFGCTWDEGRDEDIMAGQACDALNECAKLFPDKEAAYRPTIKVENFTNSPQPSADGEDLTSFAEHSFPPEPKLDDPKYQAWSDPAGKEYGFALDHLRWRETVRRIKAKIAPANSIEEQKNSEEKRARILRALEADAELTAKLKALERHDTDKAKAIETYMADKARLQFLSAPEKAGVPSQEIAVRGVVKPPPLSNSSWIGLQEVTIQEADKPQNVSPHEYTIPAQDVQDFAQRQETFAERTLNALLKDCPSSDGCYWLPVAKAASLTFITTETKITLGRSRLIANKIEAAGFCVEPDVRFGNGAYDWNQTLGLFKSLDGSTKPSLAYLGTANLFRLCVLVAAADGRLDQAELDVVRKVIENQLEFSEADHQRLLVLERLLTQDPSSASKTLARVAKAVPAQKRLLIGKVLVRVAAAGNVITKAERRALERIFKAFEILPDTLATLMREACPPPHEATTQEGKTRTTGERIPPVAAPAPQGFALDWAKVYSITNETREVVGILSVVMEDEPEKITLPKTVTAPAPETPEISSESKTTPQPTRFNGLDSAFHPILERLLTRESWPQADFNVLARDFHFMPLNIHDTLNEWADEVLGDFILDGEDPVVIRRELIAKETS